MGIFCKAQLCLKFLGCLVKGLNNLNDSVYFFKNTYVVILKIVPKAALEFMYGLSLAVIGQFIQCTMYRS